MSLRARLLAAFAYALLIVIVALMVPLASNLSDRVNAEVRADSAAQAQVVAASVADQLGRPARLREVADEASARLGGRVFVVDGRGRLLADSSDEAEIGSLYASDAHPPLLEALRGEISQGTHPPDLEDLSTAVPIVRNGRTIGALEVEQSLASVNDEVRSDVLALAGVAVLALALGIGVAWILAGSISRPINALAAAARQMAGGHLSARAEPGGSSEQVEVANAFNEMADRLEAVLESQRSFVADASHQLRTPLTGMRLRLEAAAAKAGEGTETAAEIEAAERETERLSAVVGDLLALASSEEPAEPQRGELRAAASAAVARWEDQAAEQGHGVLATGDGELGVRAGERDLAVILDNLVENAIKYSPRGSTVEIDWGPDGEGAAALRVANGGGPLSDEERRRAFERFYRGAGGARRRGTGLGLPIVAALARRSGGGARLSNRPGGGVVAEVTLPRSDFAGS
ncbi:MAG: ATP-binding protein [Solirubrobacterales bacterium]